MEEIVKLPKTTFLPSDGMEQIVLASHVYSFIEYAYNNAIVYTAIANPKNRPRWANWLIDVFINKYQDALKVSEDDLKDIFYQMVCSVTSDTPEFVEKLQNHIRDSNKIPMKGSRLKRMLPNDILIGCANLCVGVFMYEDSVLDVDTGDKVVMKIVENDIPKSMGYYFLQRIIMQKKDIDG